MNCRKCGEPIDPRRAELGYDYCTRPECQEACVERVELAAVAVNKASDQYVRADEVVADEPTARWGIDPEAAEGEEPAPRRRPRVAPRSGRRSNTTKRLERAAAHLDAELAELYKQFCNAELTQAEMRSLQNERIRAFNALVRSENIRYRSFLRKPV